MISKNKIKYIRSLELKKNRNKEGKFVAEGFKVVDDLLALQPADLIVSILLQFERTNVLDLILANHLLSFIVINGCKDNIKSRQYKIFFLKPLVV